LLLGRHLPSPFGGLTRPTYHLSLAPTIANRGCITVFNFKEGKPLRGFIRGPPFAFHGSLSNPLQRNARKGEKNTTAGPESIRLPKRVGTKARKPLDTSPITLPRRSDGESRSWRRTPAKADYSYQKTLGEDGGVTTGHIQLGTGARKRVRAHGIIHTRALPFVYWRLVSNVVSALLASYQP